MNMIDFYTQEEATQALKEAQETKTELMKHVEELNNMMFILRYFLETGEALDPTVYGIELDEEEEDE